jgi:hypothetical protein
MITATDILTALDRGHTAKQLTKAKADAEKLGHMRGGSVGVKLPEGTIIGKCARLSMLRSIGLSVPITPRNKLDMFEAGFANEDIVVELLRAGGLSVVPEAELGYSYTLPSGVPVSCRPDAAIADTSGKLVAGLEFKLTASMWTAIAVHFDLRPKSDHLIQAGHYALHLGVPMFLVYSNRSEFHLSTAPYWLQNKFGPGVYDVEFKANKPLKILPFNRVYTRYVGASDYLSV